MKPFSVSFRSKKEATYETLQTAIVRGDLAPGARLVIDDLAAQIGVSPIPVREALQQLQADGFVVIEPYVGVTVTEIRASLVEEIFALLEATEVTSGRAACLRMTEDDLSEVERILREMDAAVHDLDRFSRANVRLHQFICGRAETPLVKNVMRNTLAHWDRLRRYYLKDVFAKRAASSQEEHWQMFDALRARDPDRIERIIREHNRRARAAYIAYLRDAGHIAPEAAPNPPGEYDDRSVTN
jgi:DNA-binding GntR family transcriptional regulator